VTPEIWAILVAGLIGAVGALGGVMLQRWFEQRDRREEEARRLREVARALLFEIAGFRRDYLVETRTALSNRSDPFSVPLKLPASTPFPAYHANVSRIGEFQDDEVEAIVTAFNMAASVASTIAEAVRRQSDMYGAVSLVQTQAALDAIFRRLDHILPKAIRWAEAAESLLAKRT
jgi:hypothetical protein